MTQQLLDAAACRGGIRFGCGLILVILSLGTSSVAPAAEERLPNVVVMMTDNHGAWTLGCYGNPEIRTPHIDRLAAEGLLFERAFASNPVCSPTRATFLTGLLPSQHGVHCFLRARRLQTGPDARNTLDQFTSLPEILKANGYRCGLVGKWHLGGNATPQEGFEDEWVTTPHGGTTTFYGATVIEEGKERTEPQYLTDFWTDRAVRFLEQSSKDDRPFFLFVTYNGPYALGRLLLREGQNRHAAYYADQPLESFPREPMHPWQFSNRDFQNNPISIRRVATEVSGVDDGVGRILATLEKLGQTDDTLVMFTADQGWVGGQGGFFGMGDHTRPTTAADGMMQIPLIVRHPGQIPSGKRDDSLIANYDLFATMLGYLGLKPSQELEPASPGVDFSPVWRGESMEQPSTDPAVFYEFETLRAIRTSDWKYVHRYPDGPHELFHLAEDPGESLNLVDDPAHQHTVAELRRRLLEFYDRHASPKYDLWNGGGSQTVLFTESPDLEESEESYEPPPLPTDYHQPEFHVPEGYEVELAAGPPLVEHPMMAGFDDRGRLFVAESAGLNLRTADLEEQLPNSIRMLTDRDGDGRFDHATTFADNLTLPMGALWHDGALYVASPPYIWKLRDTDDDGVADERVNLAGLFGYSGNAASVHGCFLGPEGRIYWCDGRHGHEFRDDSGAVIGKGDGSYIFSCWPDGSDLRMHCGGGMDNPVEVDFTETGEMLGTVNILLRNPRVDCLVHWLHGGAYPHHERVLGEFVRTGDLLGPVHEFGHVAVSGMTRYRSGILDRGFRDDLFVSVFNLGQVLRVEVTREGASFRATEHEFLRSTSPDCHPTDVLEDADGSLLVVDTGGWFRIGCPTSQIAKPEIKGGIYRVRRKGMPQFADPRGHAIDWENISPREVSARLAETRPAVVEQALAECGRRANAEMIAALRRTLARADSHVRRNAVWGLSRIRRAEATSAILPALEDDASHVRLAACHALAAQPIAAAVQPLIKLLTPAEPPAVRREAATALGRTGQAKEVIPALMTALPNVVDRTEEHAILYALIELGDVDALGPYLAAASPVQRRGALIAIGELDDSVLDSKTVLACATADDVPLSRTAIEILSEHPEWAEAGAEVIRQTVRAAEGAELSVGVRNLIGRLAAEAKTAAVIGEVLADSGVENALKVSFLEALQEGGDTPLHSSWEAPIHRALVSNHAALRLAAIQTTAAMKSNAFDDVLRTITADESHSAIVRLAALESLQQRRPTLTPTSFAFLLEMLADETAGPLRMRTARLISGSQLSDSQLLELTERLALAGPLEIHDLILPFKTCRQNDIWERFASVVRVAPGFASLQPTEIEVLWKAAGAEVVALQRLVTELEEQRAAQTARLAELVAQIDGGDPQAGRAVFMSEKAKCSTCHRVKNAGGRIGPDLSRIGRIRQRRDLLEAIVFPSASFVREFQPYQVIDTRGRVLSGLVAREDETSILLQPQTGDPIRLARDDIERIVPAHVSIMPAGLDRLLSREDLANLVAYLEGLR